jgi:hypothetical protein
MNFQDGKKKKQAGAWKATNQETAPKIKGFPPA